MNSGRDSMLIALNLETLIYIFKRDKIFIYLQFLLLGNIPTKRTILQPLVSLKFIDIYICILYGSLKNLFGFVIFLLILAMDSE